MTTTTPNTTYRLALGAALAGTFLLVWLSLGVGIIGADCDPANLMYFAVIAVGIIGVLVARFRALGMAGALAAMALAQTVVAAIALIGGLGRPYSGPLELIGLAVLACCAGVTSWVEVRPSQAAPTAAGNARRQRDGSRGMHETAPVSDREGRPVVRAARFRPPDGLARLFAVARLRRHRRRWLARRL